MLPERFHRMDPMFASTARIWLFLRGLYLRRTPWAVQDAAAELEVHPKTILRYVRFLGILHTDAEGKPIVTIVRNGRSPHIQLRRNLLPFESDLRDEHRPRARRRTPEKI